MGSIVDVLDGIRLNTVLNVALEELTEALLIIISKLLHVLSDVAGNNVLSEDISIKLLSLNVETGETLGGVGDVKTTIGGTLKDTEDTGTSGGSLETNIKEDLEGTGGVLNSLSEGELTGSLIITSVSILKTKLVKSTTSDQETGSVGSSPVGKTVLDTVAGKLVSVSSSENNITDDLGRDNLGNDVLVGETNNKSVLGGVVLGLVLSDQSLTSVVVGLTLTTTTEGSLVTGVVSRSLGDDLERHFEMSLLDYGTAKRQRVEKKEEIH